MNLNDQITRLADQFEGFLGMAVLDLHSGEHYAFNADRVFPTASVIKLPVLITLMQLCEIGEASLDEPLMLRRADLIGGSGVLQHLSPGLTMPVRDWAFLMMNVSDNLATNVLIDHIGLKNVQSWLSDAGYLEVQLHRKIDFGALAQDQKDLGTATPRDLTRMMAAVFNRELVSPAACDEMMRMMDKVGADRVGRYLPFNPFGEDEPEQKKLHLAGKTGSLVGTRAQTAAVWRGEGEMRRGFVITVMTEGSPGPERWSADSPGVLVIGRIALVFYEQLMK